MMSVAFMVVINQIYGQVMGVPINPYQPMPIDYLREGLAIHKDDHNCCVSCGYSYCDTLDTCVRPWETFCQSLEDQNTLLASNMMATNDEVPETPVPFVNPFLGSH